MPCLLSLSLIWSTHIFSYSYVIEENRAIFLFHDGAQAWDAKEFLVEQDLVKELTLEGQTHLGRKNGGDTSAKNEL